MSNQLQKWHESPLVEKNLMAKRCIQTVTDNYSCDAVIPRILTLYKQTVIDKGAIWPKAINKIAK